VLLCRSRSWGLVAATTVVLVVMVAQGWASQDHELDLIKTYRPLIAPKTLDWVDRNASGEVAGLDLGKIQHAQGNYDLYTDFFNRKVNRLYSTVAAGEGVCHTKLGPRGGLSNGGGPTCGTWPRNLVIEVGPFKTTLYGQRVLAKSRLHGTLVRIPPGPPRVLSLLRPPCGGKGCAGELQMGLYLDQPGQVVATFGPGDLGLGVQAGAKSYPLRPDRDTTVPFPVSTGAHAYHLPVNWVDPATAPELKSVVLKQGAKTQRLW